MLLSNTSVRCTSLLVAIGLLGTLRAKAETATTNPGNDALWRAETVFQVAVRTDYASTQGLVTRRDAIAATTHLRFVPRARPYTAGLMIEYQFVDQRADTLLVAGMFTYKTLKWTAAASPFYKRSTQPSGSDWHYWGTLRRQTTSRHSLGVELFGALESGGPSKWTLGYYGKVSETLSVSVTAGSGFGAGPDWVAGTSLTWRPRPSRH